MAKCPPDNDKPKVPEPQHWRGGERRSGQDRRKAPDRRDDLRFEPGKIDRRKGQDRRKDQRSGWDKTIPR